MRTERIMLDGIETGSRRRAIDQSNVERIKGSIAEIGLQTPITVMSRADGVDTRMILVAGAHRLEALRQLGEDATDCFVIPEDDDAAELWEIDENFARAELTDAQRADHHARREAILVRRGVVRKGPGQPKNGDNLSSYSEQTAGALGVDKRTVQRDLARGKKIDPDILAEVTGTDLDKGVVLDELASAPRAEQRAALTAIQERRSQVRPAADPLDDPDAHEKQLAALMAAWNRAAAVVRQEFILRIEAPVFDSSAAGRAA